MDTNAIWMILDCLKKIAHFVPIKVSYEMKKLAKLYVHEIVRLHGVLISVISDKDSCFTSKFWGSLQMAISTSLDFSTIFHT